MDESRPGTAPIVLAVEPSDLVRRLLVGWLEALGYHPLVAAGGLEAVELYRRYWREVIAALITWEMPGFDGERTLAALRTFSPGLRCCFLTAESDPAVLAAMRDVSGCPPLQKPIILPELVAALTLLKD